MSSSCTIQRELYSSGFPINRYHPPFLSIRPHLPPSTFPFSLTRGLTSIPGTHFQSNERIYTSKRPHQTETNLPWNPCPAISYRPNQRRDTKAKTSYSETQDDLRGRSSGVKGRQRRRGRGAVADGGGSCVQFLSGVENVTTTRPPEILNYKSLSRFARTTSTLRLRVHVEDLVLCRRIRVMLDSRALCPLTTVSFRLPNRGNELILMSRLDLCYNYCSRFL